MTTWIRRLGRRLLFIPAVALGLAVLIIAIKSNPGPEQAPIEEAVVKARFIEAPRLDVVPRALGYGTAAPAREWNAVSQVSGEVVEIHPNLKNGSIIAAGEILLVIDPTDYQLAAAQIEADLQSVSAELAELTTRTKNTRESLRIEERSLELTRADLDRKRRLLKSKTVSQAVVDQEERNVLSREQSVQGLRNTLNLIPAQRRILEAKKAQFNARLAAAKRDLEHTTITAPFDGRIADAPVEARQYVAKGQVVARLDDIAATEVTAQIPIDTMLTLMPQGVPMPQGAGALMDRMRELLDLHAVVRLKGSDVDVEWPARFTRVTDALDPRTRTFGVVVTVDDPYRNAVLGVRPPLAKNMFVEVELRGAPHKNQLVVPRAAVHGGRVNLIGPDDRLVRRAVTVGLTQGNFAVITDGLEAGNRVIVSDLVPVIDGMRVTPVAAPQTEATLTAEATGQGPIR